MIGHWDGRDNRDTLIVLCPEMSQLDPSYMAWDKFRDNVPGCPGLVPVPERARTAVPPCKKKFHPERDASNRPRSVAIRFFLGSRLSPGQGENKLHAVQYSIVIYCFFYGDVLSVQ